MDKKLHIEIFGRQYTLRGQSDQAYADELVALVDKKMREISKHSPGSPFSKLAVLAAINIAHELVQANNAQAAQQTALDGRTRAIIKSIEESFETFPSK